jgi:hypothetical protein
LQGFCLFLGSLLQAKVCSSNNSNRTSALFSHNHILRRMMHAITQCGLTEEKSHFALGPFFAECCLRIRKDAPRNQKPISGENSEGKESESHGAPKHYHMIQRNKTLMVLCSRNLIDTISSFLETVTRLVTG